jgi:hypothetical protein
VTPGSDGDMPEKIRIVRPTDPDFTELLESGRLVSGADIQALWHAWNAGEIPEIDKMNATAPK